MSPIRRAWGRLPEEVRRCARPLNLADEVASFLPPRLRAPAATASEMARRLLHARSAERPVVRLSGPVAPGGPPLTVVLAADPLSVRYFRQAFFAEPPAETVVASVAARDVPGVADRFAGEADLALWQVAWPHLGDVRHRPLVPSHVPMVLPTDRPFDAILTGDRRGRGSRKDDARRVRKLGLTLRVTRERRAAAWFHRTLYEPYTRQRFGALYRPIPPWTFRHALRSGWLLLFETGGRPVAGALLERFGREVRILAFGVDLTGPVAPALALEACYFHSIAFAVAEGVPALSLGTVRPLLTDGVLRYKRKWGARLVAPTTWDHFLLHWRATPGTRAALTAAPLVVRQGDGRLVGLVGTEDREPTAQLERIDTPGLAELIVLTGDAGATIAAPGDTPVRVVAHAA